MGILDQLTPYIIQGAAAQQPAPQIGAPLSAPQFDPNAMIQGLQAQAPAANMPPSLWQRLMSGLGTVANGTDKFVNGAMNSPLFNLGLGFMAGGTGLTNPGQAIQQASSNYLQNQLQRQQLMQNQLYMQAMLGGMSGGDPLTALLSGQSGQQQPPQGQPMSPPAQAPSTGAPSGPQSAPQGTPSGMPGIDPQAQRAFSLMQLGAQYAGSPVPWRAAQGKAAQQLGEQLLASDPSYQTQLALSKSPISQDQLAFQQALAAGDLGAARNAQTKLLTDAGRLKIANNNGAATLVGGGDINQLGVSGVNPEQGYGYANGREFALPGAPGAQAAIAAGRSGGEAAGQAPYDMVSVQDKQGNSYLVPKSSLLAPGTAGSTQPAGTSGPALSEVGPQTEHALASRGQQASSYVTQLQDSADAATTSNYALDNVVAAARGATLGPGAPAREAVLKGFTALAQAVNPSFKPPTELSSYQELDKYGNQLGFATARTLGSREAAQIVQLAIASNPNKTLTPQSFGFIASSMKAMNNYVIAKNQAIQGAEQRTPGSAQQASSIWTSNVSPQAWDLALDPRMAAQVAPKLGADKIATSLPFMSSADAVSAFRNIPASMRAQVLAKLPQQAKQELAAGLRQ